MLVRLAALLVIAPVVQGQFSKKDGSLLSNAFSGPFKGYDFLGSRKMSPHWTTHGTTKVSKNFIRLTTDRQSKRGYALNSHAVDPSNWIATLTFRVSGVGEKLFGDGLALWFIDQAPFAFSDTLTGSSIMGGPSKFRGFGILLDTFKNPEPGKTHKDVSVVINDGTADQPDWLGLPLRGCDAAFRYWEKRDDFDATKALSKLRITYRSSNKALGPYGKREVGTLRVEIDPKANGKWKTCVDTFEIKEGDGGHPSNAFTEAKDSGWSTTANLAISAATGGVADNHDVISLDVVEWNAEEEAIVLSKVSEKELLVEGEMEIEEIKASMPSELITLLNTLKTDLEKKLEAQHHEFEHSIVAVKEALENEIKKRKEQPASGGAGGGSGSNYAGGVPNAAIDALKVKIANNAGLLQELTSLIAQGGAASSAGAAALASSAAGNQGALTELTGATKAELRTATNDLSRLRREMETNIIDQAAVRSSLLLKLEKKETAMVQALAEQEQKTAKELHLLMEKQTRRLVELEKRLEQKGEYAKREMHQSVSKRLQGVEGHLTQKIDASGGGGWKLPLLFLFLFVAVASCAQWRFAKKLTRTHLL